MLFLGVDIVFNSIDTSLLELDVPEKGGKGTAAAVDRIGSLMKPRGRFLQCAPSGTCIKIADRKYFVRLQLQMVIFVHSLLHSFMTYYTIIYIVVYFPSIGRKTWRHYKSLPVGVFTFLATVSLMVVCMKILSYDFRNS